MIFLINTVNANTIQTFSKEQGRTVLVTERIHEGKMYLNIRFYSQPFEWLQMKILRAGGRHV